MRGSGAADSQQIANLEAPRSKAAMNCFIYITDGAVQANPIAVFR